MNLKLFKYFKDEKARLVIAVALAIVFFSGSYLASYYYKLGKLTDKSKTTSGEVALDEKNKPLSDDFIVMFMRMNDEKVEEIYYKTSIRELKNSLKVDKLTEGELEKVLAEDGFKKKTKDASNAVFFKEDGTGLQPNKYNIGSMDGKLSIYKSDEKGNVYIEKAEDITEVPINIFPEVDQEKIKNFSNVYNTREECEEALTAYTS